TYDAETEHAFALKCFSCSHLIHRAEEYCPNCGAGTDKDVFDEKELSRLAVFVESALEKLNFNPVLARAGNEYWLFHYGSSEIRIFVFKRDYLYAVSPLNELPVEKLEAFYTFVLSDPIPPFKLGVSASNQLFISYRIHISDIFVDEAAGNSVAEHIKKLAETADRLDDELVDTYGCKMTVFAKKELKR
ncbi:MAG: serine protease, partial [Sinomicrobium sp.]|nr:serine protease [Sinomicrobium sp.]